MPEMKTLGGYEVVDAKAREDITGLRDELPTKVSQLENDSKFITREEVPEQDLSEYITESELNAKGYATEQFVTDTVAEFSGQDSFYIDFTAATSSYTPCDEEMIKFAELLTSGGDACVYIKDAYDGNYYPAIATVRDGRITLSKGAINLNVLNMNTPFKWDVIDLILTDKWYYYKLGSNEATFVTTSTIDAQIAGALTDYALKEEIPSVEGLATEEYVNTAVSEVACKTEVINVASLTETSQYISDTNTKEILTRIANGEKFPFCLYTASGAYMYPASLAADSRSVYISPSYEFISTNNSLYATRYKYSFDLNSSTNSWYGTKTTDERLVRSYAEG